MKAYSGGTRARLLSSVGTAVFATLVAGGAQAAETNIDQAGVPTATATAGLSVNSPLTNNGAVTAGVEGADGKIGHQGVQTGVSSAVTANTIAAKAIGNSNQAAIPALSAIGAAGAAILNTSVNAPGIDDATGVVNSAVSDSQLSIALEDFQSGSATNSGNTISADTTLNSASSSISGSVPEAFVSSTAGSSMAAYPTVLGDQHGATGTVVVSSAQQAIGTGQGAGSNASVTDNDITLELTSTADNTVTSGPALEDNSISATFKGNAARNTADIQAGLNPQFAGSAVVTNLQLNAGDSASAPDAAAARNTGSRIGASVGSADFVNTLEGSLSVAGNSITSAATGNEAVGAATGVAGNRILLGDGMSITGAGGSSASTNISYDDGSLVSLVGADLVIHNSQGNVGLGADQSLNSVTEDATIGAVVQALDGGSISVAGNRIASSATGNTASSAVATGENTATFSASVALANQQVNDDTSVGALTSNTDIGAIVGLDGSVNADSVSVANNTSAANAYGNQVSQNVSLEANSIALGAGPAVLRGGTGPDGHVITSGAAVVSNLQGRYGGAVTATNADSEVSLSSYADDTTGSTLAVANNRQEAVAVGSSGTNGLSLASGASTGSGAGVANIQIGGDTSAVEATLAAATAGVFISGDLGDTVGGSASLTDNLQRAIGYGNSASNTLAVAGNSANVPLADDVDRASTVTFDPSASNGLVFDNTGSATPGVVAAYGLLNDQSILSDVTAAADGQMVVAIGTDVQDASSVTNSGNALVAAAYGNDVANGATVTPGQIDNGVDGGFAAVANVTNVQTIGGGADILASATGGNIVATAIDESVEGSSVATSGNAIQALAYGNRSTGNTLSVTGTNIDTAPALGDAARGGATLVSGLDGLQLVTNASFSVQNAQSGQGSVTATQRNGLTDAAQVRVAVGDEVVNSNIAADGNLSTASATSNSAVNSLGITANGLQTTSAVQNFQTTNANVSALIGLPGVPGAPEIPATPDTPFSFVATGSGIDGTYDEFNDVWQITAGSQEIDPVANGLSVEQVAAILASGDGWSQPGGAGTVIIRDATGRTVSSTVYTNLTEGSGTTLPGVVLGLPLIPATPSVPNQGRVTHAVGGSISASQLSVDGNTNAGSVTGNNANNALTVAATNIGNGSGLTSSVAGVVGMDVLDNSIVGALADHALSNTQAVEEGTLTSEVFGTFALDTTPNASVVGSTLSVSDNEQSATTVANTAVNTLKVGDQNTSSISAGSALASFQSADAAVVASSDAELFAPAAVTNSTVNLTGNGNTSLGVLNDVTNTLTVQAANVASIDGANNVLLTGGVVTGTATGDHVLGNRQVADTSVTSTASTRLYNEDQIAAATSGLVNSSLTIGDNSTVAEASANRALNGLSISGGASQGASAGIANAQSSSAGVQANATTSATLTLAANPGDPDATPTPVPASPALNGSSATISGNSTTALARGNAATNVLNASAGSSYGSPIGVAGSAIGATPSVTAAAGVLNNQVNSGDVSASSLNVSYSVALNATPGNPAVSNSAVRVAGNQVAAQAFGNSATNSVTLAALNTGAPTAAVGNYQVNSGAIRATATTVTFGTTGVGAVAGSSFGVTGNQVAATAIGNSAVSTITAAR